MTVWLYEIGAGEYNEVAVVEDGAVVSGDEDLVLSAFPDGVPDDESVVAREFTGPAVIASVDFDMEWTPGEEVVREEMQAELLSADRDPFWWEGHLDAMAEKVAWGEDADHALFGFAEEGIPEFVRERMREAVLAGSPIFSDIESIPASQIGNFRMFMMDELQDDGWTISSMRDEIADEFGVEADRAETMARSTTQNMVSEAAEQGYRERDDFEDLRFRWAGPSDHRNSDVCEAIKEEVPDGGLPMDELKKLVEATADEQDLDPRGWSPHPNCRHRPLRVVD